MNEVLKRAQAMASWLWRHASAAMAVVLIVAALLLGYQIGRPGGGSAAELSATEMAQPDQGERTMYTCSMHPSVRLPDPDAKCPICFMDLIPVVNTLDDESPIRITMSEAASAMSRIETARVASFFPTAEARLYGKVTYDETSVARLTSYFSARIDRLFVNYVGVPVAKGDHIAEVYSPELLSAFEELRQAATASQNADSMSDLVRSATRDTLTAAREKLRLYGLTEQQVSSIERGKFVSDELTIFAPIGGVVTHLAVREGDYVDEGSPIATVADLTRLWLDLEAYESQLPVLRWGQSVSFTVEAHPGETFRGRISFIEPIIDERTRTAAVRVAVDNTDRRLKPGMFASAVVRPKMSEDGAVVGDELEGRWVSPMHPSIVKSEPGQCDVCGMDLVPAESLGIVTDRATIREPLVIPRSAVLFTGKRSVVYVEVPDAEKPTYEGREIVLGPRAGEFYIVKEGLQEGERVVVNGAFRIDSAMQIAAKPSMMMPGGDGIRSTGLVAGPSELDRRADSGLPGVPDALLHGLDLVYAAYLQAQEALADDDFDGFVRANEQLQSGLMAIEESGLVGESLALWRRAIAQVRVHEVITNIESARVQFQLISRGVIALEERFGHHGDETWHVAYCPMAFDFTGAEWLQRSTQIDNPYFGATMLRCGEILRELPPSIAAPSNEHEGHNHE